MTTVTYSINLSADGCCDHTKFGMNGGEEMHQFFADLLRDVDLVVWGRKTYELMVPYWPDVARDQSGTAAENDFARVLTDIPKVVFSRTLESADDNTRIIRDDLPGEFRKLKQQPGTKKISIGGVDLPSQLIAHGLVDEFHFVVHPVIVGEGRRIFSDVNLQQSLDLKLVDSKRLNFGAIALHYVKQ